MQSDLIDEIVEQLIIDEGLKLKPYICPAGKVTIGIGRNLQDKGITRTEAVFLCRQDILECEEDLRIIFKDWNDFSKSRKTALINMRFNLGPGGFRKFENMVSAIQAGYWNTAGHEARYSKWFQQVGTRAERIVKNLMEG